MYLYIRTWALIDTGKYLTTIYMVYLYLCSSDAVMQWATPATLFRSHVFALIKTAFFFLLLLSYTDDHKRFMSFDDALSSFSSLMFFKKLTRSVKNGGGRRVRGGGSENMLRSLVVFWNIPVVFSRFSFCETRCTQISKRGYDDQSIVCFIAFSSVKKKRKKAG